MSNPLSDLIQKAIATLKEAEGLAVDPNPNPVDPTDPDPGNGGGAEDYTLTRGFSLRPDALTGEIVTAPRFPFSITDNALRTVANGGSVTSASGHDIRIEDGAALVPYERDSYNATTGTLKGWMRWPSGVGVAGKVLSLKAGKSGDTDQADPTGTWATYMLANRSNGTDRSAGGRDLVLGSGVTAGTDDKILFNGAGGIATFTGDLGFLRQATVCWFAHIVADAGYFGTNNGFMHNPDPNSANSTFMWRNEVDSLAGAANVLRTGAHRQGQWGVANGPPNSALGGSPVSIVVNYLPESAPVQGTAGGFPELSSSTAHISDGALDTYGTLLEIGRGPFNAAGVSVNGSIGPIHARPWAYGAAEYLMLARLIAGWNAIQLADSGGNYVALAAPPDLGVVVPATPPTANNDTASTAFQTLVNIPVLANDQAGTFPLNPASVAISTAASSGTAAAVGDGTANYTPATGFDGTATFGYTVADTESVVSNEATVTITVAASGGGTPAPTPGGLPVRTGTLRPVTNASELTSALNQANPGDHIVLANGSYGDGFNIQGRPGNQANPIVIRAENPLQATLGGNGGVCISIAGDTWVAGINFDGFRQNGVEIRGTRPTVIGCRFADFGRTNEYIRAHAVTTNSRTDFARYAYCLIENPRDFRDGGTSFNQWRWGWRSRHESNAAPYDAVIERNHFRNFPNQKSAGYSDQSEAIEMAPVGSSFATRMIIRHNLIENFAWTQGGGIDAKGGYDCIIEFNTFLNLGLRAIDFRNIHRCTARHNWLENTQGLHVYGRDHNLIGNRIVGSGYFGLLRGNGIETFTGDALQRVVNCLVQCNIGTLRIGQDYSSTGTGNLPTGVQVNGHSGTISIQSGSGVTQNGGFSCPANQAVKLTSSQVGPGAFWV